MQNKDKDYSELAMTLMNMSKLDDLIHEAGIELAVDEGNYDESSEESMMKAGDAEEAHLWREIAKYAEANANTLEMQ